MVIVLRGNAASGKSTVALLLQDRLDRPAAILSQDHFRRSIYAEREQDSLATTISSLRPHAHRRTGVAAGGDQRQG